jgi:spermidine synthase
VKPLVTLAKSGALVLQQRDDEFVIRINGAELMSSKRRKSEVAMARFAKGRTLIGGLGLGFTLDAVTVKDIVVAEIEPAVVEWNRTFIKTKGLDRCEIFLGDVFDAPGKYDSILLDVDNGPIALDARNTKLYTAQGVARFRAMLNPKGVLVVWSAGPEDAYVKRLGKGGFKVEQVHEGGHVIFVARL